MRVTKREHACMILDDEGQQLVIDPGNQSGAVTAPGLVAIVITHEHADHWDAEHLEALRAAHPGVPIYGPEGVAQAAEGFDVSVVHAGERVTAGPFRLRFFGGEHAVIHRSIPVVDNLGVLVNERFYYPGDSYAVPDVPVALLAAPAGAPWLKIGDVMDFVVEVAPRATFAVHDAPLSEMGLGMAHARIEGAVSQGGGEHHRLGVGDSVEI
ncbi:MBL fold metallo-hydrolase [Agrococcus sp. BE272]|uniref:MBL fold metallo-hydrolase n=1 Tax=Agrococcus sp. BE272 TaxID=2817727 RepID=UPI00285A74B7|nr:MBL fold metallo-hydrolase [Agrococcus sp. BE272]MDR7234148.1 L-ascorbate metabolism protein UlaG (beta-lactamase superfamily) [Agrococcus sp. BE272]